MLFIYNFLVKHETILVAHVHLFSDLATGVFLFSKWKSTMKHFWLQMIEENVLGDLYINPSNDFQNWNVTVEDKSIKLLLKKFGFFF